MQTFGSTVDREPAGRAQSEGLTAASTELMLTLTAGEVKAASFRQAEDKLAVWTLDAVVAQQGAVVVRLVLLLPDSELLTGESLMLRGPR